MLRLGHAYIVRASATKLIAIKLRYEFQEIKYNPSSKTIREYRERVYMAMCMFLAQSGLKHLH